MSPHLLSSHLFSGPGPSGALLAPGRELTVARLYIEPTPIQPRCANYPDRQGWKATGLTKTQCGHKGEDRLVTQSLAILRIHPLDTPTSQRG